MSIPEILALPVVAFLAFFLKGIVGIGVGIVSIPLLSLILGAKDAVVLASMVNVIGSLVMYRIDPQPASRRFWWPIAALMIMGAVFGGIALKLTPCKALKKFWEWRYWPPGSGLSSGAANRNQIHFWSRCLKRGALRTM